MVPVKPFRMMQTSIFTPVLKAESRLIAEFKFALREEAKAIEKRVARLLGNPGTARRAWRGPAKKKAR